MSDPFGSELWKLIEPFIDEQTRGEHRENLIQSMISGPFSGVQHHVIDARFDSVYAAIKVRIQAAIESAVEPLRTKAESLGQS